MDYNSEAEINALQISEQNKQIVELINQGLEKEEIAKMLGYRKEDTSLLSRLYVERKLYENAIMLLHEYESHNDLSQEDRIKVTALKHHLRELLLKNLTGSVPDYFSESNSLYER